MYIGHKLLKEIDKRTWLRNIGNIWDLIDKIHKFGIIIENEYIGLSLNWDSPYRKLVL